MRSLFKWAFRLLVLVVLLLVAAILLRNIFLQRAFTDFLHNSTGMDAKIGSLDLGLFAPTVSVDNLKLFNPPQLGGSPFLEIPELYADLDRDALRAGQFRLRLLRLNISELDVTLDKDGHSNLHALVALPQSPAFLNSTRRSNLTFNGVETLNLTLQKIHVSSAGAPNVPQEINFDLTNQVFTDVFTRADLNSVAVVIAGHARVNAPPGAPPVDVLALLRQILR